MWEPPGPSSSGATSVTQGPQAGGSGEAGGRQAGSNAHGQAQQRARAGTARCRTPAQRRLCRQQREAVRRKHKRGLRAYLGARTRPQLLAAVRHSSCLQQTEKAPCAPRCPCASLRASGDPSRPAVLATTPFGSPGNRQEPAHSPMAGAGCPARGQSPPAAAGAAPAFGVLYWE